MSVLVQCPGCQRTGQVPDKFIGKLVKCPQCAASIRVQGPAAPSNAPPPAEAPAAPVQDLSLDAQDAKAPPQPAPAPSHSQPLSIAGVDYVVLEEDETASHEAVAERPLPPRPRRPAVHAEETANGEDQSEGPVQPRRAFTKFEVKVISDPEELLQGTFDLELSRGGLRLCRGEQYDLRFSEVQAKYRMGNSFSVLLGKRWVVLAVMDGDGDREDLAKEAVAYLNGAEELPQAREPRVRRALSPVMIGALAGLGAVVCAGVVAALGVSQGWFKSETTAAPDQQASAAASAEKPTAKPRPAGTIPEADWRPFTPSGGRFSVLMPGTPTPTQNAERTALGVIREMSYLVERPEEDCEYILSYTEYPASISKLPPERRLDGACQGLTTTVKGITNMSRKSIALNDSPGTQLEVEFKNPRRGLLLVRFYVVANRTYMLLVQGKKLQPDSADAQKFFDSFEVERRSTGPVVKNDPKPPPPPPPPIKKDPVPPPIKKDPPPPIKKDPPPPSEPDEGMASARRMVDDLALREIRVQTSNRAPPGLCWAADGRSFYHLEGETGVLRRIALNGFQEVQRLEVKSPCSWLSPSAEGLLVTLSGQSALWVVDPETLEVKRKIEAGFSSRVVSAPTLSIAFASSGGGAAGTVCSVVDLKKGRVLKQYTPRSFPRFASLDFPMITPDGKYLFTRGGLEQLLRFKVDGAGLMYEESSQRIAGGAKHEICISPDSQYVCLPSGGGNANPSLKSHPAAGPYSTFIYPVKDINKPAFFLNQGAHPTAVGFDPRAGLVYAQNGKEQLIVFSPTGTRQKAYSIPQARSVRHFLVHPEGRKLLLLTEDKLYYVELPR